MGREARATAKLTPAERQSRKLARIARGVRNLQVLYEGLRWITDWEAILEEIRPHLTFPVTDAEWRWVRTKLGLVAEPARVVGGSDGDSAAGDGDRDAQPASGALRLDGAAADEGDRVSEVAHESGATGSPGEQP